MKGKPYGTARAAGKGQNIKAKPVVISIDDDQEYIEEVESKDIKTYGVNGLIERRSKNHQDAEAVDEDTKLFAEAVNAGNSFTATEGASIEDEVEEEIEKITTLKNEFVNGVPRNFVDVVLSEMNRVFSNHDMISKQRIDNTPSNVYDYWTKSQEAANYAKDMTPNERIEVEQKLNEIMEQDAQNQVGRKR